MVGSVDALLRRPVDGADPTAHHVMTSCMSNARNTAIAFRDDLLANDWPDDVQVAVLTAALPDRDPVKHMRDLRASGALLECGPVRVTGICIRSSSFSQVAACS
jgi:hypothetical protein